MTGLQGIHHIALIASDYQRSKAFYVQTLGLRVVDENYRADRDSWKLDLRLPDGTGLELFSFPDRENRLAGVEPVGLRHLAFSVADVALYAGYLKRRGVTVEEVRVDPYTGRKFTFFHDPDGLPLELYEQE
ncbi:MAG: VOC family protein [Rhodobacteraceae bacterium]|nr:VOC family protein [Paracoccaceae bacterium]